MGGIKSCDLNRSHHLMKKKKCWYEICIALAQKRLNITLSPDHCWHLKKDFPIYDISVVENQIVTSIMSLFSHAQRQTLGYRVCLFCILCIIFAILSASTAQWLLERSHMIPHLPMAGWMCKNVSEFTKSQQKVSESKFRHLHLCILWLFLFVYLHLSAFSFYTRSHSERGTENGDTLQ